MTKVVIMIAAALLSFGCRKHPIENRNLSRVTVRAYWDLAEIAPQNATLLVYDSQGKLYAEVRVASRVDYAQFSVDMAIGRYTMVVFNELRDQIEKVNIRGWMNLETLRAYIATNQTPLYTFANNGDQVHQPGILATATTQFEVTPDMATGLTLCADQSHTVELHPDRKTAQSNITVAVKGLNNARMPAVAQLRNMASSYCFATDRNSLVPVSAQFPINNRRYQNGSLTDGTISATITTFGVPGEWHHTADTPDAKFYLDLAFMLTDQQRTVVEMEEDITDLIQIMVDSKLQVTLNIDVETKPLPTVTPEGGAGGGNGSGFDADLVDWSGVVVPLPMN